LKKLAKSTFFKKTQYIVDW